MKMINEKHLFPTLTVDRLIAERQARLFFYREILMLCHGKMHNIFLRMSGIRINLNIL